MPHWTTVYDIGRESAPVGNEVRGGLAGALIGALLLAVVWKRRDRAPKLFVLAFSLLWVGFSVANGLGIARAHREAQQRLEHGTVEVAEGTVEDLVPAPAEGGFETFRIGNRSFLVSDGETKRPGLARTSARGGPVRKGARVRISFVDKSILRIEESKAQ